LQQSKESVLLASFYAVFEFTVVVRAVSARKMPRSMLFILYVLAFVAVTIRPRILAIAFVHVVFPLAFVRVLTFSVDLFPDAVASPLDPLAHVLVSIRPNMSSFAVILPLLPKPIVMGAV